MLDSRFRRAFALAALAFASLSIGAPATASVLALAPTTSGSRLHVVDVATSNSTVLEAPSCCAVQTGSVTADVGNDRVFFLSNRSGGADLYTFGYGVSAALSSVAINAGVRVTHLAYDASNARLVGLLADDAGGVDVATLNPGTGNVVVTGALGPTCCTLRAGVSAYISGTGLLYAVGKRSSDSNDQLLAFSINGGTLQNAYDLGNERIAQLVADGSTLYALSYAQDTALLRPGVIAFSPGFSFTPIGSGTSDCCFVLAGSAAIDHSNATLVALTRSIAASGQFTIRAFSLSTGSVSTGTTVSAMGLFEDSAVLFDRIFANAFE